MRHLRQQFARQERRPARILQTVAIAIGWLGGLLQGPVIAADAVTIELQGKVESSCGISALASTLELGRLQPEGSAELPFSINCNVPFSYRLSSLRGGLRFSEPQPSPSQFAHLIPYTVQVEIPTDDNGILDHCDSQMLTDNGSGCSLSNSGNGVAIEKIGRFTIQWSTTKTLRAGKYSDTLTFEIWPQL